MRRSRRHPYRSNAEYMSEVTADYAAREMEWIRKGVDPRVRAPSAPPPAPPVRVSAEEADRLSRLFEMAWDRLFDLYADAGNALAGLQAAAFQAWLDSMEPGIPGEVPDLINAIRMRAEDGPAPTADWARAAAGEIHRVRELDAVFAQPAVCGAISGLAAALLDFADGPG